MARRALPSAGARAPAWRSRGGITTVVGLVLAVQNATGLWATWAYAWALVGPGGTGLGLVFYGLRPAAPGPRLERDPVARERARLFPAFGLFFEGVIGLSGEPFLVGSDCSRSRSSAWASSCSAGASLPEPRARA